MNLKLFSSFYVNCHYGETKLSFWLNPHQLAKGMFPVHVRVGWKPGGSCITVQSQKVINVYFVNHEHNHYIDQTFFGTDSSLTAIP